MWFEVILDWEIIWTKVRLLQWARCTSRCWYSSLAARLKLLLDKRLFQRAGEPRGVSTSAWLQCGSCFPYKPMVVYDGVKEKFHKKLTLWSMQFSSKDGRIRTLSSMPIYYVSLFCTPRAGI